MNAEDETDAEKHKRGKKTAAVEKKIHFLPARPRNTSINIPN